MNVKYNKNVNTNVNDGRLFFSDKDNEIFPRDKKIFMELWE